MVQSQFRVSSFLLCKLNCEHYDYEGSLLEPIANFFLIHWKIIISVHYFFKYGRGDISRVLPELDTNRNI